MILSLTALTAVGVAVVGCVHHHRLKRTLALAEADLVVAKREVSAELIEADLRACLDELPPMPRRRPKAQELRLAA